MPNKPSKKKEDKPQVNPALKGFDIQINEFGEISSSFGVERLNDFLDKKVDDKKFRGVDVVKRRTDDGDPEPLDNQTDADADLDSSPDASLDPNLDAEINATLDSDPDTADHPAHDVGDVR
jgi:hypothetical protein